jgi:APA family basic amino acid/polyamine antiporter
MVAGTIIGASIFVQPSQVTGQVPSFTGAALVWVLAGVLTLLGALVTAELASAFPATGGVYVYLREAFGPLAGFLWGWAMFWTMHTGIIAAIAMVMASYVGFFFQLDATGQRSVAIAAVFALSWVNYLGVHHGTVLQTAITAVKVGAIALMVAAGFALAPGAGEPNALVAAEVATAAKPGLLGGGGISGLLSGLAAGLFAFGGWHMVTYNAGETVEPERTIPRSLMLGVMIVTVCYVALNAVYFRILPIDRVIASERVAADAAEALLGFGAGAVMTGLVVLSAFGALAGIVLAGPRVYYAMAGDEQVFAWLGALHPRHRTPHRAIVLQAGWAAVLIWTGTYRQLFTRVIYTEWIFFGAMALGLLILRSRGAEPRYTVPGGVFLPIVFALTAFAVAAHEAVTNPANSIQGLGLVALGAPVYYLWSRARGSSHHPGEQA